MSRMPSFAVRPRSSVLIPVVAAAAFAGALPDAVAQEANRPPSVFAVEAPFVVTLRTDVRTLLRDRGDERNDHGALMRFARADGGADSLPVELRTRGNFRRRQSICPFPPLRLSIRPRHSRGTQLAGERRLKLVTHCRTSDLYEQYVLQEYLIYRMYAVLTELSLRTRLARITYEDSAGREDAVTRYAILIEHEDRLAARHRMTVVEDTGTSLARLDPMHTVFLAVFQYFIGNTDWSIRALHNIVTLADSNNRFFPVPYDFDWSGVIATRYARPDTSLPIRSVEERFYAGYCGTPEDFEQIFARFRQHRPAIEALYSLEGLERGHRDRSLRYYEAFFRMIDDPARVRREMLGRCEGS
ncbi:MAG: hypothetical protein ACT4PJ_01495 [Gemmatimonadaceae bacterium]